MSIFNLLFGSKNQHNNIKVLAPSDFKKQIESKSVQLIDVRTPSEFKSGHIKGAKNIDFFSIKFSSEINKLHKEKPVYLYCRSGNRSKQASNKLAKLGFSDIYDLKGGFFNWK